MVDNYITRAIESFGRAVKVVSSDATEETTKAFIQPFRHKDYSYYGGKCIDIGFNTGANYLYIGSKDVRIDKYPFNTVIKTNDESYTIKRAQKVCLKDEVLYIWAVLQKCEEEEE